MQRNAVKWCESCARSNPREGTDRGGPPPEDYPCSLRVIKSQRKTRVFDAVPTEIGANNGLLGRLNHADAAAPEFGVEFSNW